MAGKSRQGKRADRRVMRTRKAIMNAFDKLVSNSSVDKITVSAIAREADIDRKTFYLHYRSIDDLANRKTEDALERVLETLHREGAGKTRDERVHIILTEVNAILAANIAVYSNIATRLSTDQVLERFEQAGIDTIARTELESDGESDKQLHMRLQFYIAGALSLYASWLRSNRTEPIETVSSAIESAIASTWGESVKKSANA